MAEPSKKSPAIEQLLDSMAGRSTAVRANVCVDPPFGCGGEAVFFDDELSACEYSISGLCQTCQDKLFKDEG